MKMVHFVYKLTFPNGKIYIGMSCCGKQGVLGRYNQHRLLAEKGKELPVYRAWRKHGAPKYTVISFYKDRIDCINAEIAYISSHRSACKDYGYNLTGGGEGLNFEGSVHLRGVMREKVWSNENRNKKLSESNKGKKPSPKTINGYKEWVKTDDAKKIRKESWTEERKSKQSELTKFQMLNGGAEKLRRDRTGMPDHLTKETRAIVTQKQNTFKASKEGKEALRKGQEKMWSNPSNRKKALDGMKEWRDSPENAEHCRVMSKLSADKCRNKVKLKDSNRVFGSQKELALFMNVSSATVSRWVKSGKVINIAATSTGE